MNITDTSTGSLVWLDYDSPASDVAGCVGIGVGGETARLAREGIAFRPVLFADATASGTLPRRVSRVNKLHRDSEKPALVGYLGLQVRKGPRMQDAPLLFISPNPRANMRQIFERNSSFRAFSFGDNLFGNDMVLMTDKPAFPASQATQNAFGRASAFGLQAFSLPPAAIPDASHFLCISESLSVGALGEIDQAKINAQPANRLLLAFIWQQLDLNGQNHAVMLLKPLSMSTTHQETSSARRRTVSVSKTIDEFQTCGSICSW